MGISYYDALLPVREPGADLKRVLAGHPASPPGARVNPGAWRPDSARLRF